MTRRVLFTSTPGVGHVHPLAPLADELVGRGHQVRWITQSPGADRIERHGHDVVRAGLTPSERMARFVTDAPDLSTVSPRARRPIMFSRLFGDLAAPVMRPALAGVVDEFRPDLVVHEFSELAAAPVATARGIPHVTVAFSGGPYEELLAPTRPFLAPVWAAEGLELNDDLGYFDHLYLHPWPTSMGARPDRPNVLDSLHMGFDGGAGAPPEWLAALGNDRPLVYVSFGTEIGPLAPWPALLDALGGLDVDAVITTGQDFDLSVHGNVPPNVRVETYVPQGWVLDRAAVCVSHAGAGSLAAALQRGVPQVCIPVNADQWDNADAVARAGVGSVQEPDNRSAEALARVVAAMIADSARADRCRQVRDELATHCSVAASVDAMLNLVG